MKTDYVALKNQVINDANIVFVDGHYCYVDPVLKIATTGFGTKNILKSYKDCIRFDAATVSLMQQKYAKLFIKA